MCRVLTPRSIYARVYTARCAALRAFADVSWGLLIFNEVKAAVDEVDYASSVGRLKLELASQRRTLDPTPDSCLEAVGVY